MKKKNEPLNIDQKEKDEISKHRIIQLSATDRVLLFFSINVPCFDKILSCLWKKNSKLTNLYEKVEEKIVQELNVVKIS